jgi:hypothetical protein
MKKDYFLILLVFLVVTCYGQDKKVSVRTELERISDIGNLPKYIDKTKLLQVSSYDTTGGNNDGFSGQYSFIRKNPDSSLVIFEETGNGVINRIWTPTPTEDTLDFYFGGANDPSYSIKFSDLFSGDVYPFVEPLSGNEIGGFYTYFPIPFEDGCKIVFRGKKLEFYQIQHQEYPDNSNVENFSGKLSAKAATALNKLIQDWEKIKPSGEVIKTDQVLEPGRSLTLAEYKEGGRILGITFQNASAFEGLNKQIDIKITWDGDKVPAIYMPVADFFGYAFGKVSMQSLLIGTKDNVNFFYFPMPFDKSAKIELLYRSSDTPENDEPLRIMSEVTASKEKRRPNQEGRLYAFWNKNIDAPLGEPHVFLEGEGKGHYVGTILQSQGRTPGMTIFFEGDDITIIDGEMRVHGTGSEDYFNGGWYALLDRWDRKVSLPLHGSLDYSLPYSRTGGYRLFISDKMPFEKEILHTIEHGPEENNAPVDYTSIAFYYADAPVSENPVPPTNELSGTYVPSTYVLYPQLMKFSFNGKVTMAGNDWHATSGGQIRIDLSEFPDGKYKLIGDIEKSPEGAEVSIWQRQKEKVEAVSFHSEEKEVEVGKYLGDVTIDEFNETITIRFKEDGNIHIKRLILEKQDE